MQSINQNITLNPTELKAYQVLKRMGAIVNFIEKRMFMNNW